MGVGCVKICVKGAMSLRSWKTRPKFAVSDPKRLRLIIAADPSSYSLRFIHCYPSHLQYVKGCPISDVCDGGRPPVETRDPSSSRAIARAMRAPLCELEQARAWALAPLRRMHMGRVLRNAARAWLARPPHRRRVVISPAAGSGVALPWFGETHYQVGALRGLVWRT